MRHPCPQGRGGKFDSTVLTRNPNPGNTVYRDWGATARGEAPGASSGRSFSPKSFLCSVFCPVENLLFESPGIGGDSACPPEPPLCFEIVLYYLHWNCRPRGMSQRCGRGCITCRGSSRNVEKNCVRISPEPIFFISLSNGSIKTGKRVTPDFGCSEWSSDRKISVSPVIISKYRQSAESDL